LKIFGQISLTSISTLIFHTYSSALIFKNQHIVLIHTSQGCRNPGFAFSKPEVTRGYLESQVILAQNLNLEVFFVLVLPRTSRMYGWQQGFSRGIIE
jgi:hypothetical protein